MELKYILAGASLALDGSKCSGCGRCMEVCPHAVFSMDGRRAFIASRERCMECGACGKNCPVQAIAVTSGVGCAYAVINGMISGKEPSCGCDGGTSGKKAKSGCC